MSKVVIVFCKGDDLQEWLGHRAFGAKADISPTLEKENSA